MIAVLFPGQGSHADGMEEPWSASPRLQAGIALLDYDPFTRLDQGTRFQQPAIFLCSIAAWDARAENPEAPAPTVGAGHSLGEYAALVAAGALTFEDALRLVDVRAAAMDRANEMVPGGMVALLGGDIDVARAIARRTGLHVANDNAPGQVVLSGREGGIEQALELGREYDVRTRRLPVSAAFHTPLMAPAADDLAAALADVAIDDCDFPVLSNSTVEPFADIRAELVANLLAPVRFRETLLAMADDGIEAFEEVGPGRVLAGLVRRTVAVPA
jgi:malonyl CoA-acyl carrier protein transacylase